MPDRTVSLHSFRSDFAQQVRVAGDMACLIDVRDGQSITYGRTASLIARYGTLYAAHGVSTGGGVLAVGPNSVELLLAFLAAAHHGVGFVPLPTELPPDNAAGWVDMVKPTLALVMGGTPEPLVEALRATGITVLSVPQGTGFEWLPTTETWTAIAPGRSGRLYLTTSGSTGEPRILVFDTDTLWSSAAAFVSVHQALLDRRRFWNILPMSYLGGLFNLGLIPLAAGGSVVVGEAFSGRSFLDFWQNVERFEIQVLWLVPTIVRGLLELARRTRRNGVTSVSRHRAELCLLGTAPIDQPTKALFESAFDLPILENFALSETTFLTSESLATRRDRVPSSVGEVLPYAEIHLRPVEADGDEEEGETPPTEILARTPYAFVGYMRPDGTIENPRNADGFMATGDLGVLDARGRLTLTGRRRDIIKKGGYFVALTEIEVLACTYPGVEEAAAVGIPHSFYGEDYVLYLRFAPEAIDGKSEFAPWLRQHLTRYKWPDRIVAVADFPRTRSGKIRKHLIAAENTGTEGAL